MKTTIVTGNTIMRPVTAGQNNLTCLDRQGNVTRSGRQTGGKAAVNKQPGSKVAVNKQMSSEAAVAKQTGGEAAVAKQTDDKAAVAKQTGGKVGVARQTDAVTNQSGGKAAVANQPDDKASGMVYGYIRVSTREQNEARQVDAMKKFDVDKMVMDKQSGKDVDRPAYQSMMGRLRPGDVLVEKSIDRLGRNYEEILEQWRIITKEKGAAIVVLDMPLLDTRSNRDLTGTLIADIVLQLLSYVAETERAFIRQRQREGIDAALARGVRFGPPPRERPADFDMYAQLWTEGKISARQAAKKLHVAHTTFLKWARDTMAERGYTCCEKGVRPVAPGQSCDPMPSGEGIYGGLPEDMARSVARASSTGRSKGER